VSRRATATEWPAVGRRYGSFVDSPDEKRDALEILRPRLDALACKSWAELDAYDEQEESVESTAGQRFRDVTGTFWDMDAWASGMYVYAKAYTPSGWRSRFPYKIVVTRGGPDDPVPDPPPGWTPERRFLGVRLSRRR
jgi:hypothetical protein